MGLTQPLVVSGFSLELSYIHQRLIFDYSHGVSFDFSGNLLPGHLQDQKLVVHMPFSTGFWPWLSLYQLAHSASGAQMTPLRIFYGDGAQKEVKLITVEDNNFSLGIGL